MDMDTDTDTDTAPDNDSATQRGPEDGTSLEYLIAALRQLEAASTAAEGKESWVAAVKAKGAAIRVRAEIDHLRLQSALLADGPATPTEAEALAEIRRMRMAAAGSGTFHAAAGLLRLEWETLEGMKADAAKMEHKRRTVEETLAEIERLRKERLLH